MNPFNRLLRLYAARIVLTLTIVFAAVHTQTAFAQANCGLVPLTGPVGATGCDVQFGTGTRYENDSWETSVAMNSAGLVVETHRNDDYSIWYRVGKMSGQTIAWGSDKKAGVSGWWPAVALGENGWVYLMYSSQQVRSSSKQYYRVGILDPKGNQGQSIDWRTDAGIVVSGDGGFHASLSVMGTTLVGAYETAGFNDTCSYAIGEPNNPDHGDYTIHWYTGAGDKRTISGGVCNNPHIAVAPGGRYAEGQILLVYDRGTENPTGIAYERGSIQNAANNAKQMYWETGPALVTTDVAGTPAIALLANGLVIEVHSLGTTDIGSFDQLRSTVGKMDLSHWSAPIDWAPSESFDPSGNGLYPALTSNGAVAVETHSYALQGVDYPYLYLTVSPVSNRNK